MCGILFTGEQSPGRYMYYLQDSNLSPDVIQVHPDSFHSFILQPPAFRGVCQTFHRPSPSILGFGLSNTFHRPMLSTSPRRIRQDCPRTCG